LFVPSDFALRFDEASRILILEHEFPDIGSINWVKLVSLKSGHTVTFMLPEQGLDLFNDQGGPIVRELAILAAMNNMEKSFLSSRNQAK
jgi:uncharacterized protein (UPF0261 family)